MKKNTKPLSMILWCSLLQAALIAHEQLQFVIIVPSYNNERFIEKNLDSIFSQKSTLPFEVLYINDCSTDQTGRLADAYAQRIAGTTQNKLTVIHNEKKVGTGTENIYQSVISRVADDRVVVCIDGDDFLPFSGVLMRLEKEYADPEVWMTYGRFATYPLGEQWSACQDYPLEVIESASYRHHANVPSHLKTFRAALLKKVPRDLLCTKQGTFYPKAGDMALMFSLLELCSPYSQKGRGHARYIADTIMYLYNIGNPLSDSATEEGREEQIAYDREIRTKPKCTPLKKLS